MEKFAIFKNYRTVFSKNGEFTDSIASIIDL